MWNHRGNFTTEGTCLAILSKINKIANAENARPRMHPSHSSQCSLTIQKLPTASSPSFKVQEKTQNFTDAVGMVVCPLLARASPADRQQE